MNFVECLFADPNYALLLKKKYNLDVLQARLANLEKKIKPNGKIRGGKRARNRRINLRQILKRQIADLSNSHEKIRSMLPLSAPCA